MVHCLVFQVVIGRNDYFFRLYSTAVWKLRCWHRCSVTSKILAYLLLSCVTLQPDSKSRAKQDVSEIGRVERQTD